MPEGAELWRKTGQRGFLITSYKRLGKNSDRAITPATEAVRVPAHFTPPGFLQPEELHNLHAQLSLGQNCHRQKKKNLGSMHTWSLQSNSMQLCRLWPARLLCQGRGVLQARILERIGQYRLPYSLDHYISCCPSRQPP